MKTTIFACIAVAAASFSVPAMAWEGHIVKCYDKHWVPAKYGSSKKLIMAAHTEWEHRNGQLVKVHYPAVYKEMKHKVSDGYYIARKAPCAAAS